MSTKLRFDSTPASMIASRRYPTPVPGAQENPGDRATISDHAKLMTITELSEWLNIPVPTLYLWVHQRRLPHIKIGRLLRFERAAIESCIGSWRVKAPNHSA